VRDMEEEMEREGVAPLVPVQRPTWVNPYEGQPELEEFPGVLQISRYCMIMERCTLRDVCTTAM
jgi:hypothetical protein